MMQKYNGVDFYSFEKTLTDEQRSIRDTVRGFVENKFMPLIRDSYREGIFPLELSSEMGQIGLLGSSISGYNCPGLSYTDYGIICQELERGDSGLRSFASVQGSLVMWPIATFGSEEQKEKWLPALASGSAIGCFGLTEADHGSDPGSMSTTATPDGDNWILNGNKMWITNANTADVSVIWARGPEGISGFLVEKGTDGFSSAQIHGKMSLRASDTGELILDNVKIPDSCRLPGAKGLTAALLCLNQARYGIAWGAVGAAAACYDHALKYAQEREQFDKPIAGFQLVQAKLVEMITEITKAQGLVYRLAQLKDAGIDDVHLTSMAKRNNVAIALDCARVARDILGAAGITDDHPIARHMANLESVYTYEGTHNIHTLIIGAEITGIPAYRG
jgi:glutaryl-CoA dehydrogenase